MRPDVPPDALGVVDAVGANQKVDEPLEVGPARERVGDVRARELVEHLAAIRLQAGVHAEPERRVGREREQVRQEVAHLVHQVNAGLAILDADVHVQTEDQVATAPPSACPRRPADSARRDRCPARASRQTDASRRRRAAARARAPGRIVCRRRSTTSSRASAIVRQMPVPTSITDWCISALTFSLRRSLPCAISSVLMCERRSSVSGSIVWYSSSMPSVKEGFIR